MDSTNGWGDGPEIVASSAKPDYLWVRRLGVIVIGVAGLLAGVFAVLYIPRLWQDPDALADQARREIRLGLSKGEAGSNATARAAEEHAIASINAGGPQGEGYLLASCALVMRSGDKDFSVEDRQKLNVYTDGIDVPRAQSSDMLLAATVAFQFGDLNRSNWFLKELLVREVSREQRLKTLRLAVQVRFDKGADEDVERLAKELAEIAPSDCLPWRALSYLAEDRDLPEAMIDSYRELLSRNCDPENELRLKLVQQLVVIGNHKAARHHFAHLKSEAPSMLAGHPVLEAKLMLQEGDVEAATRVVADVLESNPGNSDALLLDARLALSRNEPAAAIQNLLVVVKDDPANIEAIYLLSQAYARSGQTEKAEAQLQFHDKVRQAKVQLHRMERQAGANPDSARIRHEIARIYFELGYKEKALYWRNAALAVEQ